MSIVPDLPAWVHAIADYAVAVILIVAALAIGGSGKGAAVGLTVGAVVLVVSLLTRYPLGVVKVLPFPVHSAGDYLAAVVLVVSPFALNLISSAPGLAIVYLVAGVAVLGVSLITNYQYRPAAMVALGRDDRGEAQRWFATAGQFRRPTPTLTLWPASAVASRSPALRTAILSHTPEWAESVTHAPEWSASVTHTPAWSASVTHTPEWAESVTHAPEWPETVTNAPEWAESAARPSVFAGPESVTPEWPALAPGPALSSAYATAGSRRAAVARPLREVLAERGLDCRRAS